MSAKGAISRPNSMSALWQKQTYASQQIEISSIASSVSAMDHRALAILHWSERLVGRDGGKQLIIITWILRFFRLLHLEEIGRMNLATVGTNVAFAEERIVSRHLLHLGDHRPAVCVAFQSRNRFQIM